MVRLETLATSNQETLFVGGKAPVQPKRLRREIAYRPERSDGLMPADCRDKLAVDGAGPRRDHRETEAVATDSTVSAAGPRTSALGRPFTRPVRGVIRAYS